MFQEHTSEMLKEFQEESSVWVGTSDRDRLHEE